MCDIDNCWKRNKIRSKLELNHQIADFLVVNGEKLKKMLYKYRFSLNEYGEIDILLASIIKRDWNTETKTKWILDIVPLLAEVFIMKEKDVAYLRILPNDTVKFNISDWVCSDVSQYQISESPLSMNKTIDESIESLLSLSRLYAEKFTTYQDKLKFIKTIKRIILEKIFVLANNVRLKMKMIIRYDETENKFICDDNKIDMIFKLNRNVLSLEYNIGDEKIYFKIDKTDLKLFYILWIHFLQFISLPYGDGIEMAIDNNMIIYLDNDNIDRTISFGSTKRVCYLYIRNFNSNEIRQYIQKSSFCVIHKDTSNFGYIGPWSRDISSLYTTVVCKHENTIKMETFKKSLVVLKPSLVVQNKYWQLIGITSLNISSLSSSSSSSSSSSMISINEKREHIINAKIYGNLSQSGTLSINEVDFPLIHIKMGNTYKLISHIYGDQHENLSKMTIWCIQKDYYNTIKVLGLSQDPKLNYHSEIILSPSSNDPMSSWNPQNEIYYGKYENGKYVIWGQIKLHVSKGNETKFNTINEMIQDVQYIPPEKENYERHLRTMMKDIENTRRILFMLSPMRSPSNQKTLPPKTKIETGIEDLQIKDVKENDNNDTNEEISDKNIVLIRTDNLIEETRQWVIRICKHEDIISESWPTKSFISSDIELSSWIIYRFGFTIFNPYGSKDAYDHENDNIDIYDHHNNLLTTIPFNKSIRDIQWNSGIRPDDDNIIFPLHCKLRSTKAVFCDLFKHSVQ